MTDSFGEGRRFEQRLGRDATAVEAGAADLVLVDECHLQPELARPERRGIPARARTEHDEIEVIGRADGHGSGSLGMPRRWRHRADVEGLRGRVDHRGPSYGRGRNRRNRGRWAATMRPASRAGPGARVPAWIKARCSK